MQSEPFGNEDRLIEAVHTIVASDGLKQYDNNFFPQALRTGAVNIWLTAVRTPFQSYSNYKFFLTNTSERGSN